MEEVEVFQLLKKDVLEKALAQTKPSDIADADAVLRGFVLKPKQSELGPVFEMNPVYAKPEVNIDVKGGAKLAKISDSGAGQSCPYPPGYPV